LASIDVNLILDASGSMQPLINDTVGGINHFIAEQRKQPGDAYVSLTTFDTNVVQRYAARPLGDVPLLTVDGYYGGHGGNTALLDAVGQELTRYEALPVKADKTVFVITTDGQENSSREWSYEKIRALIEHYQKEKGWAFVFLGANDSAWQGERMGAGAVGKYAASSAGTAAMYANMSANLSAMRVAPAPAAQVAAKQSWTTDGEPADEEATKAST
jgi:uncharacterized protein YegL